MWPSYPLLSLGLAAVLMATALPASARYCHGMKGFHHPAPYHHPHASMATKHSQYRRGTVLEVAQRSGNFETLLTAVEAAGLEGLLDGEGPYTLFAPTDATFTQLPEGALEELLADPERLAMVLKNHVVLGSLTAADILAGKGIRTAAGHELGVADVSVIKADVRTRNGLIHVVDQVILEVPHHLQDPA